MKKIIAILFLCLLSFPSAFGAEKFSLKGMINGKKAAPSVSSEDIVTPSKQAVLYYNDNNLKKAIDVIVKIPEDQRVAEDWLLLGNILQDEEKMSDAIFMYQRAIAVDAKFYKSYYNLGNIYLADEKPFTAIDYFKKTVKAKEDFAYGYYNLGCAYLKSGDLKHAKLAFIKAIELKNTEPDFHYNLAYTYKKLNKQKLAKQYLDNYNKLMENK